jgi:tRNA/tmRNA/rRNA uracil-C5-methylase (TrmA/RlmC/RlmD family)
MRETNLLHSFKTKPLCPVFGKCGGCLYQDLSYPEELALKETQLKELLRSRLGLSESLFDPIVPSPREYHYRHRLDLNLRRTKTGEFVFGFVDREGKRILPVESCAIGREEISDFLPRLKEEAIRKFPPDYRVASLCVRSGEDGRVSWGGIGRRSLRRDEADSLWAEILGKKVFYSMETFFQNNHSILPNLFQKLAVLFPWNRETILLDLYSGVGLFSIMLADRIRHGVMIEESRPSVKMARFNVAHHGLRNMEIHLAKVEDILPEILSTVDSTQCVAMVDPPRKGLASKARAVLSRSRDLKTLFYLSCSPESLVLDLKSFLEEEWRVERVVPFDFFPKTRHLETLILLKRP